MRANDLEISVEYMCLVPAGGPRPNPTAATPAAVRH